MHDENIIEKPFFRSYYVGVRDKCGPAYIEKVIDPRKHRKECEASCPKGFYDGGDESCFVIPPGQRGSIVTHREFDHKEKPQCPERWSINRQAQRCVSPC